ncbi:unnamed protein product [Brachionus calyciflorus]|uniref:PDZ domain-containing protein n=1 Tax=Brachionus calyciflorus TaxID=104777 RepID=A0A814BF92_9BILA|nr:unnamed protein product [Brachionus calyciflorus]
MNSYPFHVNDLIITEIREEETVSLKNDDLEEYFISEPFDYIFEPDHYPKHKQNPTKSNIFKHARIVRDRDGILEYEYENYSYTSNAIDQNLNLEELDTFYLSNFDCETHLHGLMRSIRLPKWPNVGYGFNLAKHKFGDEDLIYVNEILSDSPAESCLQLGDILLELDDFNLKNLDSMIDLYKHMEQKQNVDVMVVHKSKYSKFKAHHEDQSNNSLINCENFVICDYRNE